MNIVAEGNDENARTFIDLQKGSVTSEIQNKLKDGASYEVNTPNSIMAVRGTIFRVDVEIDENKNTNTKLTVFQGTVGVRTIMPDGTVSEEEIKVEAGNELTVEGTPTTSEYSGEPVEIDYDSLPEIIQDYIEELAQSGMKPGRDVVVNTSKAQEPEPENAEETLQDSEKQPETKPESELEEEAEEAEQEKSEQPESARLQRKQPETTAKTQEQQPEPESQNAKQPEITQPAVAASQEAESQQTETQSKPQSTTPQTDSSSQQSSGGGSKGKTKYYTVTFQYNGSTFGTQRVKKGEKATEPKLCPTENGAWDYDFSTKVNKNLVIQWKEQ